MQVAAKLVNSLSFTIPSAKCIKDEAENNSLDMVKMVKWFVKLSKAAGEEKSKVEDRI